MLGVMIIKNYRNMSRKNKGFTLIEVLVVIGIIAILAAIVLIAINPARQFAQARDTQRRSDVNAILNAISQNIADNRGIFTCGTMTLPNTATKIEKDGTNPEFDLRSCLVPAYIAEIPLNPTGSSAATDFSTYDTNYVVYEDAVSGRITASSTGETESDISVTR